MANHPPDTAFIPGLSHCEPVARACHTGTFPKILLLRSGARRLHHDDTVSFKHSDTELDASPESTPNRWYPFSSTVELKF